MNFPKRKNIQNESRQLLVIVGSRNPVKISCADAGFHQAFSDAFLVEGLNVSSDVDAQPVGDKQTLAGATNRAKNSRNIFPEADFWVGIEGGVDELQGEMYGFAWVVVIDRSGRIGKAKTATFFLPEAVAKLVRHGVELGDADDRVFKRENSKQNEGSVGILTNGTIVRKEYYQNAVVLALIPFLHEKLYPLKTMSHR
jgi:inosine/xanthosine triphosphatase